MAKINQKLLAKIVQKTGLSKGRIYKLIDDKETATGAPSGLAALLVARDYGVAIKRFSTEAERGQLAAYSAQAMVQAVPPSSSPTSGMKVRKSKRKVASARPRDPTSVFLIHGRDLKINASMNDFLRAIGLKPIEFSVAVQRTIKKLKKGGNPFVGDILDVVFEQAKALIVLFTPDDHVQLKQSLWSKGEKSQEKKLTGQSRPNVVFEAGLALGRHQEKTIFVTVGKVKPFSDIAGRHMLHMNNSSSKRRDLANRLRAMGCPVNIDGDDWESVGVFAIK